MPRLPSEIVGSEKNKRVLASDGTDVTEEFVRGAELSAKVAKKHNATVAILKAKSPSCGHKKIYDGTFSKCLVDGNGIACELLLECGLEVFTEGDF